jgi:hypothetical protein
VATFLKNLARFLGTSNSGPQLFLAAFGKHPGWNDHIDDLGLDTDELVTAKRLLYVQGINQNIDAAAWEKLEPDQRIDKFRHNFLWHMPGANNALIAGRLWSSVDGKGRDKYPMVVCVETRDLPDNFAASVALPFLHKTQERCVAAPDADAVRRTIDSDRDNLRALLQSPIPSNSLRPADIARVANAPEMNPNREGVAGNGFHRIVYAIVRQMSSYRPANLVSASRSMLRRPEQIRVPTCGMQTHDALLFWLRFCLTLLDPANPILLLAPDPDLTDLPGAPDATGGKAWIDIIVGDPAPQNLFCIKAKNKTIPLTSDIPYTLDPAFAQSIDRHLQSCTTAPPTGALPQWPAL